MQFRLIDHEIVCWIDCVGVDIRVHVHRPVRRWRSVSTSPVWANKLPAHEQRLEWVYSLIPEIAQFRDRKAMQLSGGQQKLVALARSLMPGNKLLLLDEPFEGVAPVLSRRLSEVIAKLGQEGLCVLISESDDTHSADLVDAVFRIERGSVTAG